MFSWLLLASTVVVFDGSFVCCLPFPKYCFLLGGHGGGCLRIVQLSKVSFVRGWFLSP